MDNNVTNKKAAVKAVKPAGDYSPIYSLERFRLHMTVSPLLTVDDFNTGNTRYMTEQAEQIRRCESFDRKIKNMSLDREGRNRHE